MLDIESKYVGDGIFDIVKKVTNSSLAKKLINSASTKNLKRVADSALNSSAAKHLKRAAESSLGQEIKKSVLSGVTEASKQAAESAFEQLGISGNSGSSGSGPSKKRRKRKKKRQGGRGIVLD